MYTIDRLTGTRNILVILICCFFSVQAVAQMSKENQKKIKKVEKYYKKRKYEKAGMLTNEVINAYPLSKNLWELYNQSMYANYQTNMLPLYNFNITLEGGGEANENAIKSQLEYIMQKPKYDYYNAIYYSASSVPYNSKSSTLLRTMYVDSRYFTMEEISSESIALFNLGEKEFHAKNYQQAIIKYEQAYKADSSNYKALLYVGDCYFAMEYYGQAASYFRKAMAMQPLLNEPVKYLADALQKKGESQQALSVAKQSLLIYPEETVLIQIHNLLTEQNSDLDVDRNWVLRLAPANVVNDTNFRDNFYDDRLHFQHYQDALVDCKDRYNALGMLKSSSDLSEYDRYLEVQSWKAMLEATKHEDIPSLEYSRKMEAAGMLAPYLFISLFNVDCYSQYRHFVENNEDLAQRYINEYLITTKKQ